MPSFGNRSMKQLDTLRKEFQDVFIEVIKVFDLSIIQGRRGKEEQNRYYDEGTTTLRYPESNHNKTPCDAADCIPWPTGWKNIAMFYRMMAALFRAANKVKAKVRSGGDWRRDGTLNNYTMRNGKKPLQDRPHIEYKGVADKDEIAKQANLAKIYDAKADEMERVA